MYTFTKLYSTFPWAKIPVNASQPHRRLCQLEWYQSTSEVMQIVWQQLCRVEGHFCMQHAPPKSVQWARIFQTPCGNRSQTETSFQYPPPAYVTRCFPKSKAYFSPTKKPLNIKWKAMYHWDMAYTCMIVVQTHTPILSVVCLWQACCYSSTCSCFCCMAAHASV